MGNPGTPGLSLHDLPGHRQRVLTVNQADHQRHPFVPMVRGVEGQHQGCLRGGRVPVGGPQGPHPAHVPEADGSPVAAHPRPRAPQAGPGTGDRGGDEAGGTQKKCQDTELDRLFLDETGFRPSLPPTCTWAPPGVRPVVPHENSEGRRVNILAALAAPGTHKHAPLTWRTASHPWQGEHILAFLRHALGRTGSPAGAGGAGDPAPIPAGPGPELNASERTFRQARHGAMPRRTQPHARALLAAVHTCFGYLRDELVSSHLSMR